jgi:hypothetical protein
VPHLASILAIVFASHSAAHAYLDLLIVVGILQSRRDVRILWIQHPTVNNHARRTDAHMMSEGEGNYGPLGVLDWIHDTTLGKDVVDDLKMEMEKHHVDEKASNAIDGAGDAAGGLAGKLRAKATGNGRRRK